MKIEQMKLADLKPYAGNAKKHDERQIKNVMQSIKNYGVVQPLVVDKDNVLIIGHCRLIASKRLKLKEVPVVRLEDLSEDEAQKLRLLDNKLNESEWDFDLLAEQIPELDFDEYDIDWGIEQKEEDTEIVEDEPPAPPEIPFSQLGDLWLLGEHRLLCGDSTDMGVIEALTEGNKVDVLFTDPPYGMNLDTDYSSMVNRLDFAQEKNFTGGKKYAQGKVDEFHPEMITTCLSVDADEVFLWGADYFAELLPNKNDGSWIVWDKRANGNDDVDEDYSSDKMYGSCFELCWSKKKHKRDIARVKWAGVFGTEKEFDHKRWHPTQKPIALASWFLERYSKDGQSVLDLFGGSGSTLMACEQLGRKCYLNELDEKFVDVIVQRYINFRGDSDDVYLLRDGKKIAYKDLNFKEEA